MQTGSFSQLANPIFNDVLGVDPRIVGLVLGFSRVADAITDPIVGFLSDETRSRWGRRRPWIFGSAFLCSFVFAAIWMIPRGMSTQFYIGWLIISALIFQMCLSLFSVPHGALGMELTPDYHERTNVMAVRSVFAKCGGFLISSLYLVITMDGFTDMAEGMRHVGVYLGGIIFVLTVAPAVLSREHPTIAGRVARQKKNQEGIWASALHTLRNGPFLVLLGVTTIMLFGLTMVSHLNYYLTIYYMFDGTRSETAGLVLTMCGYAGQIGGLAGLPVMLYVSRRIGKRRALLWGLVIATGSDLTKWVCFTPTNPFLALVPNFMSAFVLSSAWTLMSSMLPDVVDYDELKTGQRREGMFSGIHGWTTKLGMSLALVLSGFVLSASGFDPALGPGQSDYTITFIRVCYTFIPASAMVLGAALMYFFPLTEKRSGDIRLELETRRSARELEKSVEDPE